MNYGSINIAQRKKVPQGVPVGTQLAMNKPVDGRVGEKALPPLQNNQAANAAAPLTMRKPSIEAGLPMIASAAAPATTVRPQYDTAAVGGDAPDIARSNPLTKGGVPSSTVPEAGQPQPGAPPAMGTGQSTPTPAENTSLQNQINWIQNNSLMSDEMKAKMIEQAKAQGSVRSDFNYTPPATDQRVNDKLDQLNAGTNINVVDPTAPKVGGRFDAASANLTNSPSITDQTKANMGSFGSGVTIGNSGIGGGYVPPERKTEMLDKFGSMVGTNNPTAPGAVAGVGGNVGVTDSATGNAATAGQMKAASDLAANAGLLTDQQLNQYLKPYEDKAARIANEGFKKGSGYFNKIGAGGNVDAFNSLSSDLATRRMEDVGGRFSEMMKQNLAQRPEMLNAAASQYGSVGSRENQNALDKAKVGLENRSQDIQQRGQDVEQRSQDIGVQQANADRLSKEMLGFAGLDVNKYQTDKGFDADAMKLDVQKQLESRGMDLKEAQFKADEFAKAFDRSFATAGADTQNKQYMADLALKADQGDVQSMLTHSNLLLQQAVQSGQLTNEQTKMMLDNLMQYWQNPQEMAAKWKELQNQLQIGMKQPPKQGGLFGIEGLNLNIGL